MLSDPDSNFPLWLPQGFWTLDIPLFSPSTFTCRHVHKQAQFLYALFSCIHLLLHFRFFFYFHSDRPGGGGGSVTVSSLHLFLFSIYITVSFFLSNFPSIDYISLSLFCIHVLRRTQKPAMLECMCSRSGADCATAEMSF